MKLRHIAFFLLIASGAVSYFYSREIYLFYLRTYYQSFMKENPDQAAGKARRLYADKKYDELEAYLGRQRVLYPASRELKKLAGLTFLEKGREMEGARLLLETMENDRRDLRTAAKVADIIFRERWYSDVVKLLGRYDIRSDPHLTFISGVSHYHIQKYDAALTLLEFSRRLGNNTFDLYYFMGLILEKKNRTGEAIGMMERASALSPSDREVPKALIRLYKKAGRIRDAERVLSQMKD